MITPLLTITEDHIAEIADNLSKALNAAATASCRAHGVRPTNRNGRWGARRAPLRRRAALADSDDRKMCQVGLEAVGVAQVPSIGSRILTSISRSSPQRQTMCWWGASELR